MMSRRFSSLPSVSFLALPAMKIRLAALLAFCFALPAAADVPKVKTDTTRVDGPAIGMVWKVEGGKVPVYLAGSLHLLREKDLPPPAPLQTAYAASEQVWLEIPPGDMEDPAVLSKIMTLAALPADQTLQDVVPAETYQKVQAWNSVPAMKLVLQRTRPWFAALTIMVTEYQLIGVTAEHGVEKIYQARAKKDGKATGGFESAEEQIGFFSKLTDKQQAAMLDQTFAEVAVAKEKISDMITAWKTGDTESLAAQMSESFKDYPEIQKLLLDDRNARWVPEIEKFLAGDKPTLVIVGAGHLSGKNSVNELLEKKGWKLTRMEK